MNAETTGKFICRLRKEKGYTQAVLAEKLNMSNRTISKWENGDGFPDITVLPEIAKTLDVTVDELLKGERAENKVPDIKVTEIENTDNLNNLFLIAYVISLFTGIFGALLGGITEAYSIWAFKILFYTHWEIIFVACSLFCVVLSGLIFSVGVTRLGVSYSADEIKSKVMKKGFALTIILSIFPLAFLFRLIKCFLPDVLFLPLVVLLTAVVAAALTVFYRKHIKRKKDGNE